MSTNESDKPTDPRMSWYQRLTDEQKAAHRAGTKAGMNRMTPEQKAAHRACTKAGMNRWHAARSDEDRLLANKHIAEAALCRVWTRRQGRQARNLWKKGHKPVNNTAPAAITRRTVTAIEKSSVKRILKEIVIAK